MRVTQTQRPLFAGHVVMFQRKVGFSALVSVQARSCYISRPFAGDMAALDARDAWTRDFNEAKLLGDDCFLLLQERNAVLQTSTTDASVARLSAASRRKVNALNSMVDRLEASVSEGGVCVPCVHHAASVSHVTR